MKRLTTPRAVDDALALGAEFTDTGLVFSGRLTLDQLERIGRFCARTERALQWWIGDWFNAGEEMHGELFAQVLDAAALDPKTVEQYAWVCRCVAPERRRADLSFSHHREVAAMLPDEQTTWLTRAADAGIGHARLRREISHATKADPQLWVLASATDPADAEKLADRLQMEGRSTKVIER